MTVVKRICLKVKLSNGEAAISFEEAASLFDPPVVGGTVTNFAIRGCYGVVLESEMFNGKRRTSREAVKRFIRDREHSRVNPVIPDLPATEGVEYRHLPGFIGYCVGSDGSLWSCVTPNKIYRTYGTKWFPKKTWKTIDGYRQASIRGEVGKDTRLFIHTMVMNAFVGPRPKGYDCCHGNGNPADNRLENLRWGTRQENVDDAIRHGTFPRRETNGQAKINSEKAIAILVLRSQGWTQRRIAEMFEISQGTVSAVLTHKRWI